MEMNCSRLVGGPSGVSGAVTRVPGSVGVGQNGSLSGLAFSEKGIRVPGIRGDRAKAFGHGVSHPHVVLRPRRSLLTVALASKDPADNSADFGGENATSRPASGLGEKQAKLMEQNRRLMTMQKQLLEQIEERKKLRMNLVQSLNVSDVLQESKSPPFPADPPSSEKPVTSSKPFKFESDVPSSQDSAPFSSSTSSFSSLPPSPPSSFSSPPPSSLSSSPPSSLSSPPPSSLTSSPSQPPSYPSSFSSNSQSPSVPTVPSQLNLEFESDVTANKDKFSSRRTAPFSNQSRPTSSTIGSPTSISKTPSAPLPRNSPPSFTPSQSPSQVSLPQKPPIQNTEKVSPLRSQTAAPPSSPSRNFRSPQVGSPGSAPKLLTPSEILKIKKEAQASSRVPKEVVDKVERLEPEPPKKEPLAGPNVMNVVMVASECAPWSKTGGLGDVAGALPKALARRGHRVMAIAPRYANYEEAWDTTVRKRFNVAGQDMEVGYFHGYMDGVDFVFIDNSVFHHNSKNIYGGSREEVLSRMILLCKASIEAVWHVPCGGVTYGDGNLVFVANDWHTALLPVYLQAYYRDHGLMEYARSILVIHNIAHQGRGPMSDFNYLGLPEHYASRFELYDSLFGGEHMNIFMAGITFAQRIVAVSHGYAWECQTQEGGWGLDAVMREHSGKLRGVVNGIDDKEWNPELDVFLKDDGYKNFSIDTLEDKAVCKAALQRELGLPVRPDVPLVGFIGRLDHQKGVDLIAEAAPWMMGQNMQLVMLGTGRPDLEELLRNLEANHKDKVRSWVGFSVKTAHRITAGADILLMPSRFEPCGLNQLYAMKYGTIPVVHAVGGLRDTVKPFDPFNNAGYGWTFDRAEANSLIHALGNALYTYKEYKQSWEDLQKRCMIQDLSWDNAAQQYEEVLVAAKYSW